MMSGRRSTCTHNAAHHVLRPHYTHTHTHTHTHTCHSHVTHPHHICPDQVMTTVVARSDCKVSASFMCVHAWWHMIYGRWGCIDCRYVSVCMYASMRAWSMPEFVWMYNLIPFQCIPSAFLQHPEHILIFEMSAYMWTALGIAVYKRESNH